MQLSDNVVSYKVLSLIAIIQDKSENFSGSYGVAVHRAFKVLNKKYKLNMPSMTFCYLSYLLENLKNGKPEITVPNSLNEQQNPLLTKHLPFCCLQGLQPHKQITINYT